MSKNMYISYDRLLICSTSSTGIWYDKIQKEVFDLQIFFQYQQPIEFADEVDPYSSSYVELFSGHPTVAPALSFSPELGFSFVEKEGQELPTSDTWTLDSLHFGVKDGNDPIISGFTATLEQVQDFLNQHGHEIKPDYLLQETAYGWSEVCAVTEPHQLTSQRPGSHDV